MFSLKSLLNDIGQGLLKFVEILNEVATHPTPCECCQQEYPYYQLIAHQVPDPYGALDRRYYHLCFSCSQGLKAIVKEKQRLLLQDARKAEQIGVVNRHNERAITMGLPGTLTLVQWIATLDLFEWKCAYGCGGEYEELDHWIPLAERQQGTTAMNCIPACFRCNRRKGALHPSSIGESSLSPAAHQRVQQRMRQLHGEKQLITETADLSN